MRRAMHIEQQTYNTNIRPSTRLDSNSPEHHLSVSSLTLCESEVSKRGWRTERVGARNPSHTMHSSQFSAPFFLCLLRSRRTQFWGELLLHFGRCWSPTPSRQPCSKPLSANGTTRWAALQTPAYRTQKQITSAPPPPLIVGK